MALKKPPGIENDQFKSTKWDEITAGRDFAPSDAPTLALLCQWHKVAQQAMDELDNFGSQTAYQNDLGDLKAFPQIETLKKCSNEIRQLNKQLGICDSHEKEEVASGKRPATVLSIVTSKRAERRSGTA